MWGRGKRSGNSLLSVAFLVSMLVVRSSERAGPFSLCMRCSRFPEQGAEDVVFGGVLPSSAALLVCMLAGREGVHNGHFFFRAPAVTFSWAKGGERRGSGGSLLLAAALLVCMAVGREGVRASPFFLRIRPFHFLVAGAGGGVSGGSLPSVAA